MKRCVIVSAAEIKNYKKIKTFLREDDFYIFCDGGLNHRKELDVTPSLIVGDFDSFDKEKINVKAETIFLPTQKDDTDTFFAIKEGLKRGYKDFLLIGVLGNRFDHSMCNISSLIYLSNRGCNACIIDDYSEISLLTNKEEKNVTDNYSYFSLMNIAGDAKGVSITNAAYPLDKQDINAEYSYGISNEVIKGKTATVSVEEGILLLVKVW